MAKMTSAEIQARIKAAQEDGREPAPTRNGKGLKKRPASLSRLEAILERRAKGF